MLFCGKKSVIFCAAAKVTQKVEPMQRVNTLLNNVLLRCKRVFTGSMNLSMDDQIAKMDVEIFE